MQILKWEHALQATSICSSLLLWLKPNLFVQFTKQIENNLIKKLQNCRYYLFNSQRRFISPGLTEFISGNYIFCLFPPISPRQSNDRKQYESSSKTSYWNSKTASTFNSNSNAIQATKKFHLFWSDWIQYSKLYFLFILPISQRQTNDRKQY